MNVRKRRPPLGVAAVLLLLGIVVIGVVYGLWSKTLFIDGTVNTGDLNAEWIVASSNDSGVQIDPCTPGFNPLDCDSFPHKHVGTMECEIDSGDPQILHFTVTNAYPSYEADCQVEFTNTGSIPWKVEGIAVIPGPELTTPCVQIGPTTAGSVEQQCDELTIRLVDNLCTQVDPGDPLGLASSLRIHVEQPALENDDPGYPPGGYTFGVELFLVQWNESTCP